MANGRPLTNLSTLWKIASAILKDHYQPKLLARGILPPHPFGMYPNSSSVQLLRVLHQVWWNRWRHQLEAGVLSDNVRHAYGSLSHRTEHAELVTAGITDTDARILQKHGQELQILMGGTGGKAPSTTRLGVGTGQGCPKSGMNYYVYRRRATTFRSYAH